MSTDESIREAIREIQRAMYVFGLRNRSGRGKEVEGEKRELSPPEQLGAHLNMVFSAWCLSERQGLLKEHRVVQSGKSAGKKLTPSKVRPADEPTWAELQAQPDYKELQLARRYNRGN